MEVMYTNGSLEVKQSPLYLVKPTRLPNQRVGLSAAKPMQGDSVIIAVENASDSGAPAIEPGSFGIGITLPYFGEESSGQYELTSRHLGLAARSTRINKYFQVFYDDGHYQDPEELIRQSRMNAPGATNGVALTEEQIKDINNYSSIPFDELHARAARIGLFVVEFDGGLYYSGVPNTAPRVKEHFPYIEQPTIGAIVGSLVDKITEISQILEPLSQEERLSHLTAHS